MAKLVIEIDIDNEVFEDDTSADVAKLVRTAADQIEQLGIGTMHLDGAECQLEFEGQHVGQAWVSHKSLILD